MASFGFAPTIKICLTSPHATLPFRATPMSAGLDLFSARIVQIPPGENARIDTDLKFLFPYGCYGRIAGRSGLSLYRNITVGAGVVDPDYTGQWWS